MIFLAAFTLTAILYLFSKSDRQDRQKDGAQNILSYEECARSPGSIIQESFPPVCVAQDGTRTTMPITQEQEEQLVEDLDTSTWQQFQSELVNISLSRPPEWGEPEITSTSSRDVVEFENDFTITKGVYYNQERDRVLTYSELIEANTPDRRIITNYEINNIRVKRASYDHSGSERAELFVFPPDPNNEMISIYFHYPINDLGVIREYFGVLASITLLPADSVPEPTRSDSVSDCVITGCSSQICAEEEVVTTCEYKEEFGCYENAACERQADGECGWTMTDELKSCLESI